MKQWHGLVFYTGLNYKIKKEVKEDISNHRDENAAVDQRDDNTRQAEKFAQNEDIAQKWRWYVYLEKSNKLKSDGMGIYF